MSYLIEANALTKRYKTKPTPALDISSLQIPGGRIVGLLGPNGSGKTTFIKLVNGLLTPTSGQITVCGGRPGPESKAAISYLPDRLHLPGSLRICDLIKFFRDFYADFSTQRADSMLSALDIDPQARLRTLSKGAQEKIQLVLTMSRRAQLYILDEPIAGVDPAAREYVLQTILANYSDDATLLISTHLISEIENILDDVIFIRDGQILSYESAESIREREGKSLDAYFREVFAC